jgi:hypothetical protein
MVSGRTWNDQHLYMPEFMRMVAQEAARAGCAASPLVSAAH